PALAAARLATVGRAVHGWPNDDSRLERSGPAAECRALAGGPPPARPAGLRSRPPRVRAGAARRSGDAPSPGPLEPVLEGARPAAAGTRGSVPLHGLLRADDPAVARLLPRLLARGHLVGAGRGCRCRPRECDRSHDALLEHSVFHDPQ